MNKSCDLIVIGGGPAGMMIAGQVAASGAKVVLIERNEKLGRKLGITGKGRCNLTNAIPIDEHFNHFGPNGQFLRQAYYKFSNLDLIDFFEELGVPTVVQRGNRVFPASESAHDIVNALWDWLKSNRVEILCSNSVTKILTNDNLVTGVKLVDNSIIKTKKVALATGGKSYPATGSTGHGYVMSEHLGHTIKPVFPALVPLETAGNNAPDLQGVSLRNCNATLIIDGKKIASEFGEMLFSHFGLTGPVILSLSKRVAPALAKGLSVELSIDLKPALDNDKLEARIQREIQESGKKIVKSLFKQLLPTKMISVCAQEAQIDLHKNISHLSKKDRQRLSKILKDFRFTVTATRTFKEAIITSGGISLKEINPRTMESKIVAGVYFAGEIIDLDADTGGYNLQEAFSTAYLAADAIIKSLHENK